MLRGVIKGSKGSRCSKEGGIYEKIIFHIVNKCELNNKKFNSQNENELGGCDSKNDIICNFKDDKDLPIEIKKMNTPDWMQCSIKYNPDLQRWVGSEKNKIPTNSKILFENLINNLILFNGKIPPFFEKDITHDDWLKIKRDCNDFKDSYLECPSDTIKKLYNEKGCFYIQISEKGLYHLGKDICDFKVPEFICEQRLRIRTKIHTKKNSKGFCKLSVMVSCQPVDIKKLDKSEYSLDDVKKLPKNLIIIEDEGDKEDKEDKDKIDLKSDKDSISKMNLENKTKNELLDICTGLGIKGCKSKNKSQIINLILTHNKEDGEEKEKNKNFLKNISPLRYPGGKTRACKILEKLVIENFNLNSFTTVLSPFFGGGSFEFYLQNKYNLKLCVNDKFTPLYNFWNIVKTDKSSLCNKLKEIIDTGVSKEDFLKFRKDILNLKDDSLTQATYYFVINRCSFSGATLSGGFSEESSKKRFTLSSIDKISNLNFDGLEIYNYDFEKFIQSFYRENSLMFLDPPYYLDKKSKLYGSNGDLHQDFNHQQLFQTIKDKKNWIMTYNNCDFIRELYSNFIILEVDWSYGMNKSKNSSEIVILSK